MKEKFTDKSIMLFGRYRGLKLANVPADYLLHIRNYKNINPRLLEYIDSDEEILLKEVEEKE